MKEAILRFAQDVLEGGVAGATAVLVATDLATTNWKVLVGALSAGAIKGVIAAAMRYRYQKTQPA